MPIIVYLAGKMTGLTFEQMKGWRNKAKEKLVDNKIIVLDPTDTDLGGDPTEIEIVASNKFQINHSDLVLAELDFNGVSLGTISEIVYSGSIGKPVISWGANPVHEYPWVAANTICHFRELDEAIDYIVTNYAIRGGM